MSLIVGIGIAAIIAYWVYNDAKNRSMYATGYAVITFFFLIIGLPYYLIQRGKYPIADNTSSLRFYVSCGRQIDYNVHFCPHCEGKVTKNE